MTGQVECRASDRYPSRPLALHWQGERLAIARLQAEWQAPGARHFRVETEDGQWFELIYSEVKDEWTIDQA